MGAAAEVETPGTLDAEALFRAHAPFVAGFLVRLGVRQSELDDLMQEVFVVAHRRGGFVPGPARPTTWLARIAIRIAMAHRRTRTRQWGELDEEAVAAAAGGDPSPQARAEATESLSIVQQALESLDVERRALFVLFEIEEESCDEIAAGLGIPVGTVYSRLHAARRDFQKAFSKLSGRVQAPGHQVGVMR